jgi:hypothetical protein
MRNAKVFQIFGAVAIRTGMAVLTLIGAPLHHELR